MLKKCLLVTFLGTVVVGGIAIKSSPTHSAPVNQLKSFYKEENNTDIAIPNNDTTKESQISDTSKNENSSKSMSENIKKDNILESTNTNNSQSESSTLTEREDKNANSKSVSKESLPNENKTERTDENADSKVTSEESIPDNNKKTTERADERTTTNSTPKISSTTIYYDRTTSIYDDDKTTLIRVEYYLNNKLVYYSDVEQFDASTNSYIEKIYQWNYEKNIEILIRTDIYSNGRLISSY